MTQNKRIFFKFVNLSDTSIPALLKVRKMRRRCVTIGKNIA